MSLEYVYLLYLLLYVFKHLLRTPLSFKIFLTNNLLVSYIFLNFYYRKGMCACLKAHLDCCVSRRQQCLPPLPLPPSEDADNAADKEDGWNWNIRNWSCRACHGSYHLNIKLVLSDWYIFVTGHAEPTMVHIISYHIISYLVFSDWYRA